MIKEMYCSYEVSKLLKEKGFNELCFRLVRSDGDIVEAPSQAWNGMTKKQRIEFFLCPTHQMAMAWLREKYGIFIAINNDDLDFNWQCFDLINRGSTLDPKILSSSYGGFKHYEDAVEAACLYALNNLI